MLVNVDRLWGEEKWPQKIFWNPKHPDMDEKINKAKQELKEAERIMEKYKVGFHQVGDYKTREENEAAGKELCPRCNGTGNELFSMFRKCEACGATGVLNENYDYEQND